MPRLSNLTIIELIAEELEYKKFFDSSWGTKCDVCEEDIEVGDEFIFLGDKKKVCTRCLDKIHEYLDGLKLEN